LKIIGEDYPKGLLREHCVGFGWTAHALGVSLLPCQETLQHGGHMWVAINNEH
jgi:hypothetical protein